MDLGKVKLFAMEVTAVIVLGAALLWAVLRARSRGKETSDPRTEEATRQLYEAEDKAAKNEDL